MITVRYFAAARAAAGTPEEQVADEHGAGGPPVTLAGLRAELSRSHGAELTRVLGRASFLVDGVAWHDDAAPLPAGATVDVLPPFAGG